TDQDDFDTHAPPIALMTLPEPPQFGQVPLPRRPVPPQSPHTASPVPGVPGGASSPGLSAGAVSCSVAPAPPVRSWGFAPAIILLRKFSLEGRHTTSPST